MLINNLGSLKSELGRYMFHQRFAPDYDTAIQNFEAAANRRLRTRRQERTTYLTTDEPLGFSDAYGCGIPSDYLDWRAVNWTGGRNQDDLSGLYYGHVPFVELDYVHPVYLRSTWPVSDGGNPKVFTIEGGTFYAVPSDQSAGAFEFIYYAKIETILATQDGDNAVNWLLSEHHDCYLFGTLAELFALGRNREAAELYKARRDETFAEIIRLSSFTTGATSPMVRVSEYF